jgi:hypothetical protein
MKAKCVQITDKQEEFINNQRKFFRLSLFVQDKLDEYIKQMEEIKWQKDI